MKKNNDGSIARTDKDVDTTRNNEAEPDDGPTMSETGAMPGGPEMTHWATSQARPDASEAETMPGTPSKPMPGEKNHAARNQV